MKLWGGRFTGETNELVAKYNSLVDACKVLGINKKKSNNISLCCYSKRKSAYGYKWQYK